MKVAILGVGLMGGSLAAALRHTGAAAWITGYDVDPEVSARGEELDLLDAAAVSAEQAAADADLVVLASPMGAMSGLLSQIAGALQPTAIVTDLGSTKAGLVTAARSALGSAFERFVPAHPIAGSERPGLEAADADLFQGCTVVITPEGETRADAIELVERLWQSFGAKVVKMGAAEHDRMLASVSHLPHVLAFALVAQIASQPDGQRRLALAGPGFRDFTRIAASNPALWRDIVMANCEAVGQDLRGLIGLLQQADRALGAGDARWLQELFERASRARRGLNGNADEG